MPAVTMHDAKTNLSRHVSAVERGEVNSVVILRGTTPVAMIVPYRAEERPIGVLAGTYDVPADFDAHNDELEDLFLGVS